MSLGDYLRLLRAHRGGITPWQIEEVTRLERGLYRQMEQRYRAVGDEGTIRQLAEFYQVPYEELAWRQEWSRKALSRALQSAAGSGESITLHLWHGESLSGRVVWWDLGAAAVETAGGVTVVQRHAVERWAPRFEGGLPQDSSAS